MTYIPLGDGLSKTGSKVLYTKNILEVGSAVVYDNQVRYVYSLYFYYQAVPPPPKPITYLPPVYKRPGQRIVTHVNLGGSDTHVPAHQVRVLQL